MVVSRGGSTRGGSSRGGGGRGRGRATVGVGVNKSTAAAVGKAKQARGKQPASQNPPEERPMKRPASARRKLPRDEEASTSKDLGVPVAASVPLGTPPGRSKSNVRAASSHDSNPLGPLSPSSQGTPQSQVHGSASRTNLVPLQFPSSSQRSGQQSQPPVNLNLPPPRQQIEFPVEEDEEDDMDGYEDEDNEPEVHGEEDGLELDPDQGGAEGEDYDQLLATLLAHPARQSLPLLSEHPIPGKKTLW